jgi:1-acyl-sn-glycerol-3-phosphate acyltransferase
MSFIRAVVFNVVFYTALALYVLIGAPFLLMPRPWLLWMVTNWGRLFLWICRVVGGLKLEIRGRDNLPSGPVMIASKHQSAWETLAFLALFDDPCFVLKRELSLIPFFGWFILRLNHIPLDRRGGSAVLSGLIAAVKRELARGRQVIFFPEGTRRAPGSPPAYKVGVALAYVGAKTPCVPVALNAGLYWPRRSLRLRPGTVVVEFLPAIPAGLKREKFFLEVQSRIEEASDRLYEEGLRALGERVPTREERAAAAAADRQEAFGDPG